MAIPRLPATDPRHLCAGIYGPGEQRHLPRVVAALEAGLFRFVYGSPQALVDFVHVDNLVSAHVLAAEGLTAERGRVAAGQAYFISDDAPVNNFEFFRPLVEGLGHPMPTLRLPLRLVFCAAFLIELLHTLVWQLHNFQPLLTRCEVFKTGGYASGHAGRVCRVCCAALCSAAPPTACLCYVQASPTTSPWPRPGASWGTHRSSTASTTWCTGS